MSGNEAVGQAICILSFDSGGPGTYSQLLILKDYMSRLSNDLGVVEDGLYPADYFDLMGGVGFGGLIALMLGCLRMSVDDAIDALVTVATAVFSQGSQEVADPEFNSRNLKDAIEGILRTREVPVTSKMYERDRPQTRCKVVLYAATTANISHPQAFRSYSARGSSLNPTIIEGICATMAVPPYFSPVKIGPQLRQQSFMGGALGANNPTRELLSEASAIFGKNARVAQIISMGSGLPRVISVESPRGEETGRLLTDIMMDCDTVARELEARLHNVDVYVRFNVDRGLEAINMIDWNKLGDIESHTNAYIATAMINQALDSSLRYSRRGDGVVTLGQLNQTGSVKIAAKKVPSVSPYFVPRNKELEKLIRHLVTLPSSRQRILPWEAVGRPSWFRTSYKSTPLCEYVAMFSAISDYPRFKHIAYVDASSVSSIEVDLQTWVRALGDGHERDLWEDAVRIMASTPEDGRWGLILDNVDDPTINLIPFLPKNINLTIVITSRNRNLGNLSTTYHMELGEMQLDEALATLLQSARRQLPLSSEELKSAHILLKELGCLPVALVQAGTYCHELSYSFTQYLSLFHSHRGDLMKKAEPFALDGYQRGVYTTLDLSYKALPQPSREFLHCISFFHHANIPLSAFVTAAESDFVDPVPLLPRPDDHESILMDLKTLLCTNSSWGEMQVQEILRTLRSFSLISITSLDNAIYLQLHPLIQAWLRDMGSPTLLRHQAMSLQVLTTCCSDSTFLLSRHLVPHILDMLGQLKDQDIHINVLMAAGKILREQGHYRAAAGLFEKALETIENTTKHKEKNAAIISGWLATVYMAQGRWSEAQTLQEEVLEKRRKVLGMEHPDTITAAANLAVTYQSQGRWVEAEKLEVDVLEQRRRIIGMEHPDTIKAAAILAEAYRAQGRWNEAEKLMGEVLEQRKGLLGIEHPDTILAAANLAVIYGDQGRWSEAEKIQVEVLNQWRRISGKEHPNTIAAAGNLASTYRSQGRWDEAEMLEVEVLEQQKKILGMEHPDTVLAAANLAVTYRDQGRWDDAEKAQVKVLEQWGRLLGKEHPNTIAAAGNLAATYRYQSRWSEAENLAVEALEQQRRLLGTEHPDTILAVANLAATYHAQGRWSEAEKLNVKVLEQQRKVLGMEHPNTILAATNLAATYSMQSRWEECATLLIPAVQLSLKILGQRHPHTQLRLRNLVFLYRKLGKQEEAQEMRGFLIS